ncbi:MAG TPA: undecaprenyldiphospho-muramoylpentapeptide beta-N-acetylglucosaminyltransferase [Acidiferrobacterales bacterium]|nr:undecaprenyldiphospho-muramoylpentapeptide beta-N-acetylglucosaminyltransferase [Acidiferrobacterales bacterium]
MSTLLIMAGGTGGHVFPALAVAHYLRAHGVTVVWLGTRKGLEARVVPAAGFNMEWITIRALRRQRLWDWLLLPFRLLLAMWQALRIIQRWQPAAVLAMGGFVAGPGGLMAWLLRTPLLVHEQNAIAGFTNRWLALVAHKVMCGFPNAFGALPGAHHVGNPVRAEILALPVPEARSATHSPRCHVLIIGGSQGAQVFNNIIPAAVKLLPPESRPEIWHQAGRQQREQTEHAYENLSAPARVTAFIDDMAQAYSWADLVICRAGAMTIAELCAVGIASILVPFPYATDDHQTANARFLVERDAAILLPEPKFNAARLAELLQGFASARELLLKMAMNARACAMPDATEMVARLCLEAMHA